MDRETVQTGTRSRLDIDALPAADLSALGRCLRQSGYTTGRVRRLLELADPVEEILANTGRYSWQCWDQLAESTEPPSVLGRLFLFCGQVPTAELDGLDPALTTLLRRLGLVEPVPDDPAKVRAVVALTEFQGRYFLSDTLFERVGHDLLVSADESRCMPPHASSLELFSALRKPDHARSFLDVGCGSGCQSVLFASEYERVTGFDPNPASAAFARANASLNGVRADYAVAGWESFSADEPFDHVAFNTPDADTAFAFINAGLDAVLAPSGRAQVWLVCEIAQSEGNLQGALRRRLRNPQDWQVTTLVHRDSPLSLTQGDILARRLPYGTLLVGHPSEREAFFRRLAERRTVEIVSTTLTVQRR
ncbi:SAM-dependent methyltransferase [Streptacidiphilus sp. MAP12-33]|uniref:class I SAM-dependent methyltransferase n=1 Tax=Streptacidiphilus sp. MAP12-33 TaxID=3156266 RepID=UPI0035186236